jgi:hypothetical protein
MPKQLERDILYVAEQFSTAAHLCACGCGEKIRTPLGPTEWTISGSLASPSLHPSVGNWQKPCRSHYWIHEGRVHWSGNWTDAQVLAGRANEQHRREAYFAARAGERRWSAKFWRWLRSIFKG